MAKGLTFDNDLMKLIFNNVAIAGIADAPALPLTNLYVALHSADPTVNGNQTTNEIAYTGYARVAVSRNTSGWVVTAGSVAPAAAINFPLGTGGSGTATYVTIGTAATGTGKILYVGAISPAIICGNGVTPQITTQSTATES